MYILTVIKNIIRRKKT